MVKDHSAGEKESPIHRIPFPISSKIFFLCAPSYRQVSSQHNLCYTSLGLIIAMCNYDILSQIYRTFIV